MDSNTKQEYIVCVKCVLSGVKFSFVVQECGLLLIILQFIVKRLIFSDLPIFMKHLIFSDGGSMNGRASGVNDILDLKK